MPSDSAGIAGAPVAAASIQRETTNLSVDDEQNLPWRAVANTNTMGTNA